MAHGNRSRTSVSLVYSPEYDFRLPAIELLHPFDGRKYSRAWSALEERYGTALERLYIDPHDEVTREDLLAVHTEAYLDSLRSPAIVARAIEIPAARFLPSFLLDRAILRPMRLATQGTIRAVESALENGVAAVNVGGGYHHAFADHGEGFCVYADAAVAIARARRKGLLDSPDDILVIDLDAHRGNGIEDIFKNDAQVHFFDMYNFQAYPGYADLEYPYLIPLPAGSNGKFYLDQLAEELPAFLESVPKPRLAIYNAGIDIVEGDPLGGLQVDEAAVRQRDRYILDALDRARIPAVVLTSGGYTERFGGVDRSGGSVPDRRNGHCAGLASERSQMAGTKLQLPPHAPDNPLDQSARKVEGDDIQEHPSKRRKLPCSKAS